MFHYPQYPAIEWTREEAAKRYDTIAVSCSGCGHKVWFGTHEEKSRFLSTAWDQDMNPVPAWKEVDLKLYCPVCRGEQ